MALRSIIKIDEEKCNGCGDCINACAEGAIEIIDGKAKLISEIYCDGLGACLGTCPQDAISIEKRQADEFDEDATKQHLAQKNLSQTSNSQVCPGLQSAMLREKGVNVDSSVLNVPSQLSHWPVQLKLVSPKAPYFENADLLLVADCVPFTMGDFHNRLLKQHSIVIGCPKLDDVDFYIDKFAEILKANNLKSLTVVHMEVPCCLGLVYVTQKAMEKSGKKISYKDVTVNLKGNIAKTELIEG